MGDVYDLGTYRRVVESRSDGRCVSGERIEIEEWWGVYDEVIENISLMPQWMVLKLMSVCRGRIRDEQDQLQR